MLIPLGMNKSEREKYVKDNARLLSNPRLNIGIINKPTGLRVADADAKQKEKQKVEAKVHLASKGKPSAPSSR